ncbi:MAG: MmcQ/YjbR family DNA-binding protein [Acidimicrobiales bacterium]|jgi:predicted DNA-binding protein (MmcQ/YjbR family)
MAQRARPEDLLAYALTFPEAWEDNPWGETVVKVGKKVFAFLGGPDDPGGARISVKLPDSADQALDLPGAVRTGYGLGRAGWVTLLFESTPAGLLEDWIEESYRTVAPKRLSRQLDGPTLSA